MVLFQNNAPEFERKIMFDEKGKIVITKKTMVTVDTLITWRAEENKDSYNRDQETKIIHYQQEIELDQTDIKLKRIINAVNNQPVK